MKQPVPIWSVSHPNTVSGVAVDEATDRSATSCFDGNARIVSSAGQLLDTLDVSPGTMDQDRECVAYRFDQLVCGGVGDYAIAIRDNGTICRPADVPTSRTVRGISQRALFAVAEDLRVYNLTTGANWTTGNFNQFGWPRGVCEDGDTVWVCDLDGHLYHFTASGQLLFKRAITPEGLISVDVNSSRIVATTARNTIFVLDKAGTVLVDAGESSIINQAKWLEDGRIVYGTAGDTGARLVCWDGVSVAETNPTPPAPPSGKPGKHHK